MPKFVYDNDGNLKSMSSESYTTIYSYDAENQLILVEPETPSNNNQKLTFVYDYSGRRVQKNIYIYNDNFWHKKKRINFVYDDWNMLCEIVNDNGKKRKKSYIYGIDYSLTLNSTGGIGGIISSIENSNVYNFLYDANGNVVQLMDISSETIVASYKYDPYGKIMSSSGACSDLNNFRFSTKYMDNEISTIYYGYRYYLYDFGRWLNQDPLYEKGSLNSYCFVQNDPINRIDPLGLLSQAQKQSTIANWTAAGAFIGGTIGFILGGGSGMLAGPGAVIASPVGAAKGSAAGVAAGGAAGAAVGYGLSKLATGAEHLLN